MIFKLKNKLKQPQGRINKRVGDIHIGRKIPRVLNLKQMRRLYVASSVLGILIIIFAIGWFFYGLVTKAEIATFYSDTCLGGWNNPQNAEGKPDLEEGAETSEFNETNSATLKNTISELYCGNFHGDIPKDKEPKYAVIKFSWVIKTSSEDLSLKNQTENSPAETERQSQNSSTQENTPVDENHKSTTQTPSQENSPPLLPKNENQNPKTNPTENNPSEPPTEKKPETFIWPITIFSANAEEATNNGNSTGNTEPFSATYNQNETVSENSTPETENVISQPNTEAVKPQESQSTSNLETQVNLMPPPSNDFLDIQYTLDGKNWQSLGKINYHNWRNIELPIPNFRWDDISKVQVALKSLPIIDTPTNIYLDSLWIEVKYGEPQSEEIGENEIEESSLLFGTLPDFDKNNLKLDAMPTHSCSLTPFKQYLAPRQSVKFKVVLKPTSKLRPHRLVLGDLPHGVMGGLKQDTDGIIVDLSSNDDPQRGSFGVVIIYQELKNRKLLSANEVSTTVCQFNLIIR